MRQVLYSITLSILLLSISPTTVPAAAMGVNIVVVNVYVPQRKRRLRNHYNGRCYVR